MRELRNLLLSYREHQDMIDQLLTMIKQEDHALERIRSTQIDAKYLRMCEEQIRADQELLCERVHRKREARERILDLVDQLPEPYRRICIGSYLQGKSAIELANEYYYSVDRVYHILSESTDKLKKIFKAGEGAEAAK